MLTSHTLSSVSFYDFIRQMAGGDSNERIASRIGVTGATVGRWKYRDPNPRDVARFAREYDVPMLQAFVEAGFFTNEEAGRESFDLDPRLLADADLVAEVARRLQAARQGSDPEDVSTSSRLKRQQAEDRKLRRQRADHAKDRD